MRQDELSYKEREIMMNAELDHDRIPDRSLKAILNELKAGRKIEAIKLYREVTGEGLAEAKKAIESIGVQVNQNSPQLSHSEYQNILDEIKNNRTLGAVKLYRAATGAGLYEAREAVEVIRTVTTHLDLDGILSHDISDIVEAFKKEGRQQATALYQKKALVDEQEAAHSVDKVFKALERSKKRRSIVGWLWGIFFKLFYFAFAIFVILKFIGKI